MSDLYRLVYASKNLLQGTEAEVMAAVRQILDASQRNNQAIGVTGALMFNTGAFAQVLEGPRRAVEATFERIQRDLRHGDVTVLQCGPAESRRFANWSMAFVGQSARGQAQFSSLAPESGFDLARLDGDQVFAMLHGLVMEEEGIPAAEAPVPAEADRGEEELPATEATLAPRPGRGAAGLDVMQVRTEIAQLRPEVAVAVPAIPVAGREPASQAAKDQAAKDQAAKSQVVNGQVARGQAGKGQAGKGQAAPLRDAAEAALCVLKAALASERHRTGELRTEIDALQVALATAEGRLDVLRAERDLWAGRARLLADVMVREAESLQAGEVQGDDFPHGASDTRAA